MNAHLNRWACLLATVALTACSGGNSNSDTDGAGGMGAGGAGAGGMGPGGAGGGAGGAGGVGGEGGGGAGGQMGANPLMPRVQNTTCRLPEAPPLGALNVEPAYNLGFSRPLWVGPAPGDLDHLYLVEQGGRIRVFEDRPDVNEAETFLEIPVSRDGNEEGLLGLAFHPDYAENGRFFVNYSALRPRRSVISEFRRSADNPMRADPASERVLMEVEQPFSNHNGGDMHFGPDGYLYISLGDGGAGGDPLGHGQNLGTLLGNILRIDIDQEDPECGTAYTVPADNPFADVGCASPQGRREIYAWGLRNVWRMAFDPRTGDLWAADVGQNAQEEINLIERGGNYGWNAREGNLCFPSRQVCEPEPYFPPVHTYDRAAGRSITGGRVYRGPDLPELWGAYIYADFESGLIEALWREDNGDVEVQTLSRGNLNISSFGEDTDGRLLMVHHGGQPALHRLVRRDPDPNAEPFPQRLSQTGCFADLQAHQVAAGVVPYAPNAPFWSDDAEKGRWFALPEGGQITFNDEGGFVFPLGTVLIKSFFTNPPAGRRAFETRLLHHSAQGWQGFTYRWNAEGTDADLLPGALDEEIATADGPLLWHYPSRSQCDACHTAASGHVLGLEAQQLDGAYAYPNGIYNQMQALDEAGYFAAPRPEVARPLVDVADNQADLTWRARSWLHSNCAGCHRPGGSEIVDLDLRATTPLADTRICDRAPAKGDLDIENARLLAPGDPARSIVIQRVRRRDAEMMPPLGTERIPEQAVTVLNSWVQEMAGCE